MGHVKCGLGRSWYEEAMPADRRRWLCRGSMTTEEGHEREVQKRRERWGAHRRFWGDEGVAQVVAGNKAEHGQP